MAAPLSPSKPMTDNQLRKIGNQVEDVFRKIDPPSDEVQDIIENHWTELAAELTTAFTVSVSKVLARIRNAVLLVIPSIKDFEKPGWMKKFVTDVKVGVGNYLLTFEEFLREGEKLVDGEEMVRRAVAENKIAGLQHALWLLDNQHLIPTEFRGKKYLIFAGTVALRSRGRRVPYLNWNGHRWALYWLWLGSVFNRNDLLVSASKL